MAAFVKLQATPGKRDELVAAFEGLLAAVQDEKGTLVYALHTDDTDADVVWFYELYPDKAAQELHAGSDAMKATFPKLAGLIAGRPEIKMATPVGGKGLPT